MHDSAQPEENQLRDARFAMRVSLLVGFLMLAGKGSAWWITASSAIFSDAAESVVHVVAVAFAVFSLLAQPPPRLPRFQYGYERINFFSAGFEGGMIVLAAISIVYTTAQSGAMAWCSITSAAAPSWWSPRARSMPSSALICCASAAATTPSSSKPTASTSSPTAGPASASSPALSWSWSPAGSPSIPWSRIAVAGNILFSGGRLLWQSIRGLLDYSDPRVGHELRARLDELCAEFAIDYHGVRFRTTGYRQIVEVHLLFAWDTPVGEAHRQATMIEERLAQALGVPASVTTHLESREDHSQVHSHAHYTGRPE